VLTRITARKFNALLANGKLRVTFINRATSEAALFAPVGETVSAARGAATRRSKIHALLQRVGRSPPRQGAIVVHDHAPEFLDGHFKLLGGENGETVTFDFLPAPEHLKRVARADAWRHTIAGSYAHLAVRVNPRTREAFVVELQGHKSERKKLSAQVIQENKNALPALVMAASEYALANGLTLHLFPPEVYAWNNEEHEDAIWRRFELTRSVVKGAFKVEERMPRGEVARVTRLTRNLSPPLTRRDFKGTLAIIEAKTRTRH
jgi:hypothetical protein